MSLTLPERIAGLGDLAGNLWWSWNGDARVLFRTVDFRLWHATRHNPVELLRRAAPSRLVACAEDTAFVALYDQVMAAFSDYRSTQETWFQGAYPELGGGTIAYFCAEFGLHSSVPIYSGGLGVLAGDHCKAASDLGVPLVAVGLLYTRGYFDQEIGLDGWQRESAEEFHHEETPLRRVLDGDGEPLRVTVPACGGPVLVGAWRIMVGRVPVYLLDTDLDENDPADRELTHRLYAGGPDLRLRQEWLLGVGGVRVLRTLGIEPVCWHANEGHAGFMMVERVRELLAGGVGWEEAVHRVRATSVFTTHTPVPAGHDVFARARVAECGGALLGELGDERDALLDLARHPELDNGAFHMTALAIRLSERVNGVSERHGGVTRDIWRPMWPDRDPSDIPIGHVTNGVHLGTWMSRHIQRLLADQLGADWLWLDEEELSKRVSRLDPAVLWVTHRRLKGALMDAIGDRARRRLGPDRAASDLAGSGALLGSTALTIGFARRFATYKRAGLIFRDADRLEAILTDEGCPVQIIFAGKAHPADDSAKELLQKVHSLARDARFQGRIAFLEDYGMHMARRLVQGVDLWLNLPRVPMEACGTSGMKAALNGVPQLATRDGWWAEGADGTNGWTVPEAPEGDNEAVDAWDAERVYEILESEVVPLFFERDAAGIPQAWVERMRRSIAVAAARFTARRMVMEYVHGYYSKAVVRE